MPANDPICECSHPRSEHDDTLDFQAKCRHVDIDPNAPTWVGGEKCRCKEFREAKP